MAVAVVWAVSMAPVDHYMTEWLKKEANRPAIARRMIRLARANPAAATHGEEIEQRKARLAQLFADRMISPDEWRIARDRLDANSVKTKIA